MYELQSQDGENVKSFFEAALAVLILCEAERPMKRPRLRNFEPAFVNAAADFWESAPVGRHAGRGDKTGSFQDFCITVNEIFGLEFDHPQLVSGIRMRNRTSPGGRGSPRGAPSEDFKEMTQQAEQLLKRATQSLPLPAGKTHEA